jgi:rubrerythrin
MTEAKRWLVSHGFAEADEYADDDVEDVIESLLKDDPRTQLEHAEGFPFPYRWVFKDGSSVALGLNGWEWDIRCPSCGQEVVRPRSPHCPSCAHTLIRR